MKFENIPANIKIEKINKYKEEFLKKDYDFSQIKLSLKNISFYNDFNKQTLFENVNLVFKPRNIYAITGPSGSGKTTLMDNISGLLEISSGEIKI